jgi:hypothetical protein
MTTEQKKCPDDGTCHHDCKAGCWRVFTSGPLSGVYPGDQWPKDVRDKQAEAQVANLIEVAEARREQGSDTIMAQRWREKSASVQAVQLTEHNWGSVVSWLDANGVQAHASGPPARVSFGGGRGSYSAAPGDWIAVYSDSDQHGAERWADGDWQRAWERVSKTGPQVTTRDVALGLQAIVGAGDGLGVVLGHLGPEGREGLRQALDGWKP